MNTSIELILLPKNFILNTWDDIKPYYEKLLAAPLNSLIDLEKWMLERSELESFVSEDLGKRYIAMTCNTIDEKVSEAYSFFIEKIQPEIAPYSNLLDKKLIDCPYTQSLDSAIYSIYLRAVKMNIAIFREVNIPLFTELNNLAQQFSTVSGSMSVIIDDKEMTLPQAAKLLQLNDRTKRKEVYEAIANRRAMAREELDEIMNKMVQLRHQVAINAGYENFRDYMFDALGRFDYKPEDCFNFHDSVKKYIVPILDELDLQRKNELGVESLKPYDFEVDSTGLEPLKPFTNAEDLVSKTRHIFGIVDPYFESCLNTMSKMNLLDLESRKGKAPGGYLYPLPLTGVPFIFMNAVGSLRDLVTMVHEGGHAVHSFLSRDLKLNDFKNVPSEVAELASMSMELISMQHWQTFFKDDADFKRARMEQLDDILRTLPWVAAIDKFQHWLYCNPTHSADDRKQAWVKIYEEFGGKHTDWLGYEENKAYMWHKQLHLFEVPFYYIEYGFAQLGAIAIWRNYLQNGNKAIEQYKQALSLGYTKSIGEIYNTAGIKFDFSENWIAELSAFVKTQMN
ncbi:MAG TPA: M3 family oligoendopeptidase [Bacteroidia bacterium]|nr:M3 family oligoendopeptidase [Bacteroidia bacterium]